jgi:hypothetical protein
MCARSAHAVFTPTTPGVGLYVSSDFPRSVGSDTRYGALLLRRHAHQLGSIEDGGASSSSSSFGLFRIVSIYRISGLGKYTERTLPLNPPGGAMGSAWRLQHFIRQSFDRSS